VSGCVKILCNFLSIEGYISYLTIIMTRDSSVSIVTDYGLDDRGSIPGGGLGIFLFDTLSRPALGPIQSPIQWAPGVLSLGVKWLGREADHSPPSSAEDIKCAELYLHSPIRLHGVVLS
jgi:hypothetical protein